MMDTKTLVSDSAQEPVQDVVIIGAGMAGSLLACMLAQTGRRVRVIEKRPDPRLHSFAERGRSINLALAERGLHALAEAGLSRTIQGLVTAMAGRCVHQRDGGQAYFPYSDSRDDVLWSLQRSALNQVLIDAASRAGAEFIFDARVARIEIPARQIKLAQNQGQIAYQLLVGADGVDSIVRKTMAETAAVQAEFDYQAHGYKELTIPAQAGRVQSLRSDALHIWPRGNFMTIALPNVDLSFTVTLFLPHASAQAGAASFQQLQNLPDAEKWFSQEFSDLYPSLTEFSDEFVRNPVGSLSTLRLNQWQLAGNVVLIGDAAHAMLPFHGQGMNCAFEDVQALVRHLNAQANLASALLAYQDERMPNALAIQSMALENYTEMCSRVSTREFALERELSAWLERLCPNRFVSRYRLVTFSRVPYQLAQQSGQLQTELISALTKGCKSLQEIDLVYARQQVEKLFPVLDLTQYQAQKVMQL